MMRVEKSLKNFLYGSISQAISSLLSFTVRYALVHTLGIEAVSLNGLFTEVLAMLSLAEMGVGTAIVYNLYVPLRENDEKKLAELMNLFKVAYRWIALAIFTIGILLLPYVHLFVSKMEIDLGYLRLIYFLFLVQTASSYLFSYKNALLNADQRVYIISRISIVVRIAFTIISIIFLIFTKNYLLYLLLQIAMTLSTNILISVRANRQYSFLKRRDHLPAKERKQVLSNIKYLFISVLSGKIITSTDNILISTMVGTLQVGAYSCYTMIIHALTSLLVQLHHATTGGVGNLVAEGDYVYTEEVLRRLTFVTYCPAVLAAVGSYTVSTPFIRLLYGEDYVLPMPVVFVCVLNFLIYIIKNPLWSVVDVSGLFAQNRTISLIGAGLNLIISILLGRKWGITGILLGTGCTLAIQSLLKKRLLFRRFLHVTDRAYSRLIWKEVLSCILCMLASQAVCSLLPVSNLCLQIFLYGICSEGLTIAGQWLLFHRTPEFQYMVETGKALFHAKKKRQSSP
ncbi:MAG: lipopolysaccharide biosynthesis protein [Ruminococcus sp.]|nr:lipopolysaccharide biosynthesis protein [Ruminococcus sp.]